MNEAETRAELIDSKLKACGLGDVEGSKILREYTITRSLKGTFYLGYEFSPNKLVTLSISRDFEGNITKKGNLITALNLIIGLRSERNVGD